MTVPTPLPLPKLKRPDFFDGQLLAAADLEAVYAYHRDARWLQNRTLHGWGIAVGLGATGAKGAHQITIAPGYALDCQGRDLILTESIDLPVPTAAGLGTGPVPYYLTASFIESQDLERTESRKGVCEGEGVVRRVEALQVRWQRPTDLTPASRYRRGLDLILATAKISGCVLAADLATTDRRYVSPSPRPYIAAGSTREGATDWSYFSSGIAVLGVQTQVDTTDAGFERTPTYQAHLVGTRVLAAQNRVFDGFVSVVNPSSTGFTLQVAMPRNLGFPPYVVNPQAAFTPALLDTLRNDLHWSVVWSGIEA